MAVLNEEKQKEDERERMYNNTQDEEERKQLEKLIDLERGISSQRILKINK